jgi:hypothetical protein
LITSCSRIVSRGAVVLVACLAGPVAGAAAQVTITSGPAALSNNTMPAFMFTDAVATSFECRLVDFQAEFAPCESPKTFGQVPDGDYVFEVRALDTGDPTPAVHPFTVDTTAPDTTIVSSPLALSNDPTPEFAFTGIGATSFECRLVDVQPEFAACAAPKGFGPLADGAYVFEVRAVDAAGNRDVTSATRSFAVDTIPPQATITGGPGDTTAATAVFLFSAPGAVSLSCRLDGGAWQACQSPQAYQGLSLGPHRFEVMAVDAAGNADATPAHHAWQVLRRGLVIPAALKQATALARELVQIRRALARIRLRALARRRAVLFRSFDALTAGTVEIRARARVRRGARRRWIATLAGKREVPDAGRHRVRARVTKRGRRLARRRRSLPLELRLSFTDLAGRSLWATSKLTLKR